MMMIIIIIHDHLNQCGWLLLTKVNYLLTRLVTTVTVYCTLYWPRGRKFYVFCNFLLMKFWIISWILKVSLHYLFIVHNHDNWLNLKWNEGSADWVRLRLLSQFLPSVLRQGVTRWVTWSLTVAHSWSTQGQTLRQPIHVCNLCHFRSIQCSNWLLFEFDFYLDTTV